MFAKLIQQNNYQFWGKNKDFSMQLVYSNPQNTDYKVNFKHWDAAEMSHRTTFQDGTQGYQTTYEWSPGENDPLGNNQGVLSPDFIVNTEEAPDIGEPILRDSERPTYANGLEVTCNLDGSNVKCSRATRAMEAGATAVGYLLHGRTGFLHRQEQIDNLGSGLFRFGNVGSATRERVGDPPDRFLTTFRGNYNIFSLEQQQSGQGTKLNKKEVLKIANDIQAIFDNNPDCLPFIQNILKKAEVFPNTIVSQNPIDVLWAVFQQDGIYSVPNLGAGGNALGSIGRFDAEIKLMERNFNLKLSTPSATKNYTRTQELLRATDALAESIHLSGVFTYDDRDMAIATADQLGLPKPDIPYKTQTDVVNWSNWWHPKVHGICDIQKVLANESKKRR